MTRSTTSTVVLLLALAVPLSAMAGDALILHAADNVAVHGELTHAANKQEAIALLFHQARGNLHEYDAVVPVLNKLGYDTLAIDQRSGGNLFGGVNQTVAARGSSSGYIDALPDLQAALAWARSHHYKTIVAVGSSYSSALVIVLAAGQPPGLTAIASFSPGEYFDDKNLIKHAAAKVRIPFYITTDPAEAANVSEVLQNAHGANIDHYQPAAGVHGASTLVAARDPAGYKANLQSFVDFMRRVAK